MSTASIQETSYNRLLAALPESELERLSPQLELIQMPLGNVLYEAGDRMQYVWFPTTAIVSLQYIMEDGTSTEVAGVGHEGVLSVSLFMGSAAPPSRAMVQTGGYGYRIKAALMLEEFHRMELLQRLLLHYVQSLIVQISLTAVCNRHHSIEQQLCRWLLLTINRQPSNELIVTQELIASMLGVRREGITAAAGNLKNFGLINYRRGHITVLDRSGLETMTCECYQVAKKEFGNLLAMYTTAGHLHSQTCSNK